MYLDQRGNKTLEIAYTHLRESKKKVIKFHLITMIKSTKLNLSNV